jgi:heat shock protein HslJ
MARIALVVLVLVLAACDAVETPPTGPPNEQPAGLAGTAWRAAFVAGRATVAGHEPTITFGPDRVTGSGGCNGFGGSYTYVDGVLTFGQMATTLALCSGAIGSMETAFAQILASVQRVSIDGSDNLVIEGAGGQILLVPTGG